MSGECCTPECGGRECGDDGCGGTCGDGCDSGETCTDAGACVEPAPGDWVVIRAGEFEMGSSPFEAGRDTDEWLHDVTLTHDFVIQSTEVTQLEFATVMRYNPSYYSDTGPGSTCGPDCPVEVVTWYEAAAYANALSEDEELPLCYECSGFPPSVTCELSPDFETPYDCPGYRLPTEAEWEYAARAGDSRATYNGNLDGGHLECEMPNTVLAPIAWFCGNGGDITHTVALRDPNDWNLYDMLGNVAEWCHDWYDAYPRDPVTDPWGPVGGPARVLRGGSTASTAAWNRAAFRFLTEPTNRYIDLGFRVARTLP